MTRLISIINLTKIGQVKFVDHNHKNTKLFQCRFVVWHMDRIDALKEFRMQFLAQILPC